MNLESLHNKLKEHITLNSITGEPKELYQPIDYILQLGGKRVRPLMLLMSHELFSASSTSALNAAMAIEVFHNFTLIHDDIMDKAPLRRGHQTVHCKWDSNTAILSGDAMMIKSYMYLENLEPAILAKVFPIFSKTALEVCEGQQYDMNFENEHRVELADYIKMIELKTSVLIGAAMKIGAIVGGASETDAQYLYNFGRDLGIAFQLQDDYLDLYGDPDKFGKRIGGDVLANKKTYMTIKAFEKAEGANLELLNKLYSTSNLNTEQEESKIAQVRNIFNELGVADNLRQEILVYYNSAIQNLSAVSADKDKKDTVVKFAQELIKRDV